jgi:integrase
MRREARQAPQPRCMPYGRLHQFNEQPRNRTFIILPRTTPTTVTRSPLLVHDLRRSAAMNLIAAGIDEQTSMKFLGHRSAETFRRYRVLDHSDMQGASVSLDAFFVEARKKKPGTVHQFRRQRDTRRAS